MPGRSQGGKRPSHSNVGSGDPGVNGSDYTKRLSRWRAAPSGGRSRGLLDRETLREEFEARREHRPDIFVPVVAWLQRELVRNAPGLEPPVQLLVPRPQAVSVVVAAVEGKGWLAP